MKELVVPIKFTSEDVVYTTKLVKEERICDVCEGNKTISYNGKQMRCPECSGTGVIKSNKQINVVLDEPYKIRKTKIDIGTNGSITVKYKGVCGTQALNRSEENLFLTKEEAQKRCDYLNLDKKYINLKDIVIRDSMKDSHPNPDKFMDRYQYFQKTGKFKKKIFVNEDNMLVDGYITYLICKMIDKELVEVAIIK